MHAAHNWAAGRCCMHAHNQCPDLIQHGRADSRTAPAECGHVPVSNNPKYEHCRYTECAGPTAAAHNSHPCTSIMWDIIPPVTCTLHNTHLHARRRGNPAWQQTCRIHLPRYEQFGNCTLPCNKACTPWRLLVARIDPTMLVPKTCTNRPHACFEPTSKDTCVRHNLRPLPVATGLLLPAQGDTKRPA
jgi:hypothetical protein